MSNNSRLLFLFIALIGIAGLSYVIFFDENTDQQTDVQVVNEIESTTTTLIAVSYTHLTLPTSSVV